VNRIVRLILALGAIFVGGVVVSGCGSAVAGNAVASVGGSPISRQALAHWGYVAAIGATQQSPGSPIIIPDPPSYTKCIASLRKIAPATVTVKVLQNACQMQFANTMEYLIRTDWIQGQAAAEGLKVTSSQVQKQFETEKNQQFKTAEQFQLFLTQSGFTEQDILYRVRISLLQSKLATPAAIKTYYQNHLASFSTAEHRNLRIILTKSLSRAKAAKALLERHHTWLSTAKKYSIDPATKTSGGVLLGIPNGEEPAPLNAVVFAAPRLKLLGPIKTQFGYYVAEVTDIFPASKQTLQQATSTIKSTLVSAALASPPWLKKWKAKTTCRTGFQIPDCSNYTAPKATTTTTPTTATAGSPATPTTPTTGTAGSPATPTTTTGTATVGTAGSPATPTKKKK